MRALILSKMIIFQYLLYHSTMNRLEQSELDSALFKKLEELTMKIPNDPILYKEEIIKQSALFKQQFEKLLGDIQRKNQRFSELLIFLSRSVKYYPTLLSYVPGQVIDLLKNHGPNLHPYVRKKCVGSIMILRAKNILYPVQTIQFLLTLFNIEDKQLRKILYKYILNDIRRMNRHHKNVKINQQIRDYIYQNVIKSSDKMVQKSIQLMIDLYKRNIWTDNRCVNIIAEGCFSQSSKIRMISSHFLIATTQPLQQLSQSDDDQVDPSEIKFKKGIRKHTKNREKQLEKQKRRAARKLRKRQIQGRRVNFMPIDVIYSPQDFAEKLFLIISRKSTKFVHKLICFALISRLIWRHKLILLSFYSHLSKYLEPKQKDVAKIMTYLAESIHENIPDEDIEKIIKIIIQNFVNDKCSEFAMTIGLNTIRQIYSKLPGIISEEAMLYLATYNQYKNKNVSNAAKALINLVRQINPYLLEKKYRGRLYGDGSNPFTQREQVKNKIDGAQLLEHNGDIPIYMDRILTDEDFKMIRKLKRKRQEQENEADQEDGQELNWEDAEQVQGDEGEEQGDEDEDEDEDSDDEEIDWEDCQQMEELVDGQSDNEEEGQQQDGEQGQQQDGEDDEEIELNSDQFEEIEENEEDEEQAQQIKKPSKKERKQMKKQQKELKKAQNKNIETKQLKKQKKNSNKKDNLSSDSDDDEQSEEMGRNPHGFLSVDQIAFYKKSKTQIKAEKRQNPEKKQKFKHKPKDKKGGGTSNKQKQKLKPLLMLRAKKNKIRSQEKQVKLKIKDLKNQLGRVRSGKEAKKMKNKKIAKKAKK